ncbi:GDP-L-fucose synthase [Parasphingorhabdus sp.]|uniref:GDP-L-fucose synthase family protein n=1 Tax=Parasphingorhabdus sp. TaxID=2709688 RepID=UPI003265FE2C
MNDRPAKVLITGGSGMVGRNLQEHEAAGKWDIHAPSSKDVDLTDWDATREYVREIAPDCVVHAAGLVGGIQANMARPTDFLTQNMQMGMNLINAAREAGVPRLINIGSSCMYPRNAPNPLREEQILDGELEPTNEGYALAKICAARLCQYIRSEDSGFNYKTLIPCNLFGRHDSFAEGKSHLIPAIIVKMQNALKNGDREVEIWGDGTARREFMYASDLADAVWKNASDQSDLPQEMNIGVGQDHSINDYYAAVAKVVGWEGEFVHDLSKPVGMKQKLVDVTRQKKWGWMPATSLVDGLTKTTKFYLEES